MEGRFLVELRCPENEPLRFTCDDHAALLSEHDGNMEVRTKHRGGRVLEEFGELIEDVDFIPLLCWSDAPRAEIHIVDKMTDEEETYTAKGFLFVGFAPDDETYTLYHYRFSSREIDYSIGMLRKLYFEHITTDGKEEEHGWTL